MQAAERAKMFGVEGLASYWQGQHPALTFQHLHAMESIQNQQFQKWKYTGPMIA